LLENENSEKKLKQLNGWC